ncbi:MAG TPA: HAMP domain-containing sensor histidine kinase [Cyanophyceae cyanobacterium]
MFRKIRNRLFLSNFLVLAGVLAGFTLVVRLVFVRNLNQQLVDKLIVIGQGAAGNAEIENGRLVVEEGFLAQALSNPDQGLQWFDAQGNLITQRGNHVLQDPLDAQSTIIVQTSDAMTIVVTMPILNDVRKIIGYVRVSQSMNDFKQTVAQLDWGLGSGAIAALTLSTIGSLWLNRQAMRPIEGSFQRLKQFTADASHELRSPLMAISSNVEVALKYTDGMRESDREVLVNVLSATDQMTQLTEDLLLLARTDKITDFKQQSVDLTELLNYLVQFYRPQAEAKQIELIAQIEPDLSLVGDAISLARAFTNLIQNAILYTLTGGKVRVITRQNNYQIQVDVEDTGVGIAPEHYEKIFERFWRVDQARSLDGGAGLGLSITQAIIQSHGGSITVSSQIGSGSCFVVRLLSRNG